MARGDRERALYRGQRPGRIAMMLMRFWAFVGRTGIARNRIVTLEVTGRTSGRIHALPLVLVRVDGERYLASMLGDDVAWVRNVRAADGHAVLRAGSREDVVLVELPPGERAPFLKEFLRVAPGARPHIPVDPEAPAEAFEPIADQYPVFRVTPASPMGDTAPMENHPAIPASDPLPPTRDLDQFLDHVLASPRDAAPLELIVARPGLGEREILEEAVLDEVNGLVGDGWLARGSRSMPDRSANPAAQLALMSTRVLAAIEPDRSRWPLAGDQLHMDMDLSEENLPLGARLAVGTAVLEVTELPHTGCAQFSARFGADALRWISTPTGRANRMRGMYVRIVTGGTVRLGDIVRKA